MRKRIRVIIKHPLISGSIVIFIATFFVNIFNLIFNIYMSRSLSVSDFGILTSLTSLIGLFSIVATSMIPMVVNFAASNYAKHDLAVVKRLFLDMSKYFVIFSLIIVLCSFLLIHQISAFFHIQNLQLISLVIVTVFFVLLGTINGCFIQAKLNFNFLAFLNFVGGSLKLLIGILLVGMGFSIYGAMMAIFIPFIITYVLGFVPLKELLSTMTGSAKVDSKELLLYGVPSALASFGLTAFVTTDIILVKHFFPPASAGLYAGLSLVGRAIFFFSAPIGTVMFPLVVQKYAKNEEYQNTFFLALGLILLPSVCFTILYFLFPEFVIHFFIKKKEYLQVASLLGFFGMFITIYSLLMVITNFFLSIQKTNIYIPIFIGVILQVVLIMLYHTNFLQIILISLFITLSLLILFILYYFKLHNSTRNIRNK